MKRILGIGDNTVDLYIDKGLMFPGGNAVNVAVHAHRNGAETAYLGCLGQDEAGSLIYNSLLSEQVDISRCRRLAGNTSWTRILHQGNDRIFDGSNPGVRSRYDLQEPDFEYISSFDLAHSSIYSSLESDMEKLDKAVPLIAFDFSDSSDLSYIKTLAPYIDYAFFSAADSKETDQQDFARLVHSLGPSIVVITRGEHGALAYNGLRFESQDIVKTQVVDTLGAGDAFIAGFLVEYLANKDIRNALSKGSLAASKVCSFLGGFGFGTSFPAGQPGVCST